MSILNVFKNARQKALKKVLEDSLKSEQILVPEMPGRDVTIKGVQRVNENLMPDFSEKFFYEHSDVTAKAAFLVQYEDGTSDAVVIF